MRSDRTQTRASGIRVLVADDVPAMRALIVTVLLATEGIASVVQAADGVEAVEVGRARRLDVAVLDVNMPRMDGIEAALELRELQPSLQIALDSADAALLRERGAELELPLFDKTDLDGLLEWVERQAKRLHAYAA